MFESEIPLHRDLEQLDSLIWEEMSQILNTDAGEIRRRFKRN
jgi:hypothetical protein